MGENYIEKDTDWSWRRREETETLEPGGPGQGMSFRWLGHLVRGSFPMCEFQGWRKGRVAFFCISLISDLMHLFSV